MNWEQVPCNYEELCDRAAILREEVVGTEKLRWCWIAYFISDLGECRLGILFEGQHSWTNCCLLQKGYGKQANEWVKRLNEAEGISDKTTQEIVRSVKLGARACLTDDEQRERRGASMWHPAHPTRQQTTQDRSKCGVSLHLNGPWQTILQTVFSVSCTTDDSLNREG